MWDSYLSSNDTKYWLVQFKNFYTFIDLLKLNRSSIILMSYRNLEALVCDVQESPDAVIAL